MAEVYYTYMVCCCDGTLYTGWTANPERRLKEHNTGRGARYTRSRRPVRLVYLEKHVSCAEAMRRERTIKGMSRAAKLNLVARAGVDSQAVAHTSVPGDPTP